MSKSVVRSVCYFSDKPTTDTVTKANEIANTLTSQGFTVQTKRVCSPFQDPLESQKIINNKEILLSIGTVPLQETAALLPKFYKANGVSFNADLTSESITTANTEILFAIIKNKPTLTFNFTYVFNNKPSSPYFPSANFAQNGFSIGLQPTDLSEDCNTLEEWLQKMKEAWNKINALFSNNPDFLGIDSSIAPIFSGNSSLIHFIKRLRGNFEQSVTTDIYVRITDFLKKENPRPIGLCGLMFPCLEDFELAEEYENGNFSIERNLFLSLHSGLGIDTYPIGVNEKPERIVEILKLVQGLSNKYQKPLSARFVSDGKAKIGEHTNFQNQYLKDVIIRRL